MVMSASSSSTTKMRQYRRQMKKTKVLRGFTNQLKEVLGRLLGKGVTVTRKPLPVAPPPKARALTWASPEALAPFVPSQPAASLPPPQLAVQTLPQPSPRRKWWDSQWTQSSLSQPVVIMGYSL